MTSFKSAETVSKSPVESLGGQFSQDASKRLKASYAHHRQQQQQHHSHQIKSSKTQQQNNNSNCLLRLKPQPQQLLARPSFKSEATLVLMLLLLATTAALLFSSSASLQVEAIKLQPEGREKFYWSGEQFVITCQNTNNIKNVKIRWIGPNGKDITEDPSQRVHAKSTGPHGHRLVVMNATAPDDDGQYKCTLGSADDRNPREHIEFELKIHKQTSFKDTPRHLVLTAGQPGMLTCRVEFDSAALSTGVSWVRDQKPIEMFNDSTYTVMDYDPRKQQSQLIISPLTKQHDGVYTCRAMAETMKLSKISDFDIQLETNYAPTFDVDSQTVWVERHRGSPSASASRSSSSNAEQSAAVARQQQQQQQHANYYPNGVPRNSAHQPGGRNRHNRPGYTGSSAAAMEATTTNNNGSNIVQVELRCTCQANPPASILWTSTQNQMYVLAKGEPAHVLEQPRTEIDGPNTTSILLIGYNLDQDWQYKRESYICSASNKLGKASKTFTIEQGDPPPAFNVGPTRHYNPETSLFKFTLLGPAFGDNGSPSSMHSSSGGRQQQQQHEIVPPVDAFRIRAELPSANDQSSSSSSSSPSSSQTTAHGDPKSSYSSSNSRKLNHNYQQQQLHAIAEPPNVQWNLEPPLSFHSNKLTIPQNFTVNLGKLPSGNQRLYLEAHNAVGWSPDSTYLGEYYIVSGALTLNSANLILPIVSAVAASLFILSLALNSSGKRQFY